MKKLFDLKSENQWFEPGDQVFALLLMVVLPIQAKFHIVKSQVSDRHYLIHTPDRREKSSMVPSQRIETIPFYQVS